MAEYRTVEGEPGAVNVLTELTTFAGEAAAGPIKVPADKRRLAEMWVASAVSADTAGENGALVLRLTGKGMKNGQEDFIIGAAATGVTSTGTFHNPPIILPVDLEVVPNEHITVQIAVTNADVLLGTTGITLAFA